MAIFPEKFAMYFASMNSLSGKILADVQRVEEELGGGVGYADKCLEVDRRLIKDRLKPRTPGFQEGDVQHSTALLLSVQPSKPDKYVFEEGGVWIDEYSAPFTFCREGQSRQCSLAKLIQSPQLAPPSNDLSADTHPSVQEEDTPSVGVKGKSGGSFFGVNVFGGTQPPPLISKEVVEEGREESESNLPKQKQNLELIAELEAKLKRGKSGGKAGLGLHPSKVNKPKAPPPPPPAIKVEGGVCPPPSKVTPLKASNSPLPPSKKLTSGEGGEFCVDVSSPCRIATPKTGLDFLDNW